MTSTSYREGELTETTFRGEVFNPLNTDPHGFANDNLHFMSADKAAISAFGRFWT